MTKIEKRKIETLFDISRNPRINLVDMLPGEYVSTQLDVDFEYANYNDSITMQILKETEIEVPVDEQGNIDYNAVREKMRPIMEKAQKHVDQLVTQYQRYKETNNGKL